ncbi:MAG TPA: 5-oxoprolinase subunit PxpB [Chitinophagaceae bacterium]|jgi:inhibitor of KinA|nr:5-oxoprolinase subunit PxpB [Chitinophagaceae bacterium]
MINFIEEMESNSSYRIFFVGDSAATIDFGNVIDESINKKVIVLFNRLSQHPLLGMIEAIPAYSSITIYFNVILLRKKISTQKVIHEWIRTELNKLMRNDFDNIQNSSNFVRVPVCYENEFATDLKSIAEQKNISSEEIIRLHSSKQYRVYMLGFLPGFAYMGEVQDLIAVPRKAQPRPIAAGSVGIAGRQTGIYPVNSPGGWQIIGRTPLKMFDKDKNEPCLLKAGDHVEFYSISKDEFENYQDWST